MEKSKYEKYFVREPLTFNNFPPYKARLLFDAKNHFPEMGFGIRCTYITEPIHMETPHSHDFDQFFCFLGNPGDLQDFDGEVEVYLGAEQTKTIINSTTVLFVPKGMIHTPFIWTKVNKPMMFLNIPLSNQYTRSDRNKFELNSVLEADAKKVSFEEARNFLGTDLPMPSYLPQGGRLQETYIQNDALRLVISDKAVEMKLVKLGDARGIREQYWFECLLDVGIRPLKSGQSGDIRIAGEQIPIGNNTGVLVDHENNLELVWRTQPNIGNNPYGYDLTLQFSKFVPKDEIIKIANSIW
jgi:hypothetical protein